jgi:hypothetical protein
LGAAVVVVAAAIVAPTLPAVVLASADGGIIAKLARAAPNATAVVKRTFCMGVSFLP